MQTESFLWLNSQKLSYETEKLLLRDSIICYDVSYVLYKSTEERREKQRRLKCSQSAWLILKALTHRRRLTWELYSDHYQVFKCVWSYNDWEVVFLKRRHRSSNWTKKMNEKSQKYSERLYNMTKEKLLVLCKTLTELLNKQFIQVSNSSAAVCFICTEVRRWTSVLCELLWLELNHSEELLPLSLIYETLQNIKWAQWYIVECHSDISQDLNCCREQMKDDILYEIWVVWMNDDFF
jgi:hypothetical protein